MSTSILSELDRQLQQYIVHPNTTALAASTQKLYKNVAENHLKDFCRLKGITSMEESFIDHMDDYAKFLLARTSAQTTASYLTISKIFFRFHEIELKHTFKIPRNDKQARDLKHERRWFSAEDIAKCKTYRFLVNHTRNHCMVRLMIETGARVDEIAHIKAGDVRIREKTILLSQSKTIPRPVFFEQETAIYLEKYMSRKFNDPDKADQHIFPGKNQMYKIIVSMLNDIGLKKKGDGRGPHTFRHYTATYLRYVVGLDLDHVAKLLGDTPATISENYLHPTAEMLHSLMKKGQGY